jgi:hypothetical protein
MVCPHDRVPVGIVPTLVHFGSLPMVSAQDYGLAGSSAGITAPISQGWGTGAVGHSATVTWHRDLPFCHP